VSGRDVTFDEGLLALRDHMAGAAPLDAVPEADRVVVTAAESVLDFYRANWWARHHEMNTAWIESLAPTLRRTEAMMTSRLAAAYGGQWPNEKLPIDVAVYVVPNGAYSSHGRVTMTSGKEGYRMPRALEMVLHESSHIGALEPELRAAIETAFKAEGVEAPPRLWHDLIFYTSGEIARVAYADLGKADYRHYGETTGVYERGKETWDRLMPLLSLAWRDFVLSGSSDAGERERALRAVARGLSGR
jgi:hypothetical protein